MPEIMKISLGLCVRYGSGISRHVYNKYMAGAHRPLCEKKTHRHLIYSNLELHILPWLSCSIHLAPEAKRVFGIYGT